MDLEKLRALFDLLAEKDICEFEHERDGEKLRVTRGAQHISVPSLAAAFPALPAQASADAGVAQAVALAATAPSESSGDHVDVTSPFVGTFYRSPSPDTPAFVDVGAVVRPGQTLCIIEAMKLMNEIEAECSGTVTEVFAQNGKSVEYGQKLFRIKKA